MRDVRPLKHQKRGDVRSTPTTTTTHSDEGEPV